MLDSLCDHLVQQHGAIRIRPVDRGDSGFCRELFHEQRAAHFAALELGGSQLATLLDAQFRAQSIGHASQYPQAETLIIEQAGIRVGRAVVAVQRDGDTLHLLDIAILTAAQRRGIGTTVLGALLDAAAAMGLVGCTLSVLASNLPARHLYERLGFVATGDDVRLHMAMSLLAPLVDTGRVVPP